MNRKEYNIAVDSFANRLYGFLFKNTKNKDLSDDIVQDVFEKLWLNRKSVDFDKAKQWLFTTSYRIMLNVLKREKRIESREILPEFAKQKENRVEQTDLIEKLLACLSEQQRAIILLRDYEGYNYNEIGEMLGLSESQVKVYLFRARKKLKDYLKKSEHLVA